MKNLKSFPLLIFIFWGSAQIVFAQKIHISDTSNQWKFVQQICYPSPFPNTPPCLWEHGTIKHIKDTIIQSNKYSVFNDIYIDGVITPDNSGRIILRDDTVANTVLYRDMKNDSDIVLYDYNLTVGDTFKIKNPFLPFFGNSSEHQHEVLRLDTIQIDGTDYRVWYLTEVTPNVGMNAISLTVIEGIGSITALTLPLFGMQPNPVRKLECFNHNNNFPNIGNGLFVPYQYSDTSRINLDSCKWAAGIESTISKLHNVINVYPNPTTGVLKLNVDPSIKKVLIKDLFGRIVYSRSYNTNGSLIDLIDISNIENGVYLFYAYDFSEKLREVKKVIKL